MNLDKQLKVPVLTLLLLPLALLVFGIYHGFMQTLYRAGVLNTDSVLGISYYQGLTAHGIINAVVLTTFFAVAFGHVIVTTLLGRRPNSATVWTSLSLLVGGSLLVAGAVFAGKASVLYTFYPPMKASPVFYVGLAAFVVGSWVAFWGWIPVYLRWRREYPQEKTPLPVVGIMATFIVWQLATLPVAYEVLVLLLPWSLGWTSGVNVVLARTLFWFFGHPLVYFWLLPAYTMYYTMLPKLVGGELYSDVAGRFVFLAFCVLSAPLGFHHQFADPGISAQWKAVHTVLTSLVAIPSVMTAFTVAASLELGARRRGGKGLFAWWLKLPFWDEKAWLFPYLFCGLLIFIFGGATGVVNASFNLNNVVHNTSWVPAHFHLTVGGPVFLAIIGMSLYLIAMVLGRPVTALRSTMAVPYLWLAGLMMMSGGQFIGGLRGEPRRTNLGLTYLNPNSELYRPQWVESNMVSVMGGCLLVLSALFYFYSVLTVLLEKSHEEAPVELPIASAYHNEEAGFVRNFTPWVVAAVVAVVCAYAVPIYDIVTNNPASPAAPFDPGSPVQLGGN